MSTRRQRLIAAEERAGTGNEVEGFSLDELAVFRDDPLGWCEHVGLTLWSLQKDILRDLSQNRLVAVVACQAAGKSHLSAVAALHWLSTRPDSQVVVLSGKRAQVNLVFQTMKRIWLKTDLCGEPFDQSFKMAPDRVAYGIVGSSVEHLVGYHAPGGQLVILEEMSGVEPKVVEAALAMITGEGDVGFMIGNAGGVTGPWADIFLKDAGNWLTHRITAYQTPNITGEMKIPGLITQQAIDDIIAQFGANSDVVARRIGAEFNESASQTLADRSWVTAAFQRHADLLVAQKQRIPFADFGHEYFDDYEDKPLIVSCDLARYGADSSIAAVRQHGFVHAFHQWSHASTVDSAHHIARLCESYGKRKGSPDLLIVIDSINVGAGVYDRLKELGWGEHLFDFKANRAGGRGFMNIRAEMFWAVRRALEEGKLALPENATLMAEIMATTWDEVDGSNNIRIAKKAHIKSKLGGRSIDRLDALAQSYAVAARATLGAAPVDVYF